MLENIQIAENINVESHELKVKANLLLFLKRSDLHGYAEREFTDFGVVQ
jgi:hypothetical protein